MMVKPMKTLELHYPMIPVFNNSYSPSCFESNAYFHSPKFSVNKGETLKVSDRLFGRNTFSSLGYTRLL